MNITTSNYAASVQAIDWNAVPASLKKTHETLMPDASKDSWKSYNSDEDVKRVVDKYFGYIAKYMPAAKAAPAELPLAPATPPKEQPMTKTKRTTKPGSASTGKKPPKEKSKLISQATVVLPEPKQVTFIPTATAFIKRYAALHGKVKTRDQILSLAHGLQKAITEQRIKNGNPALREVERMQNELLTLLSVMTGSMKIDIDAAFLAHCKQIAQGEEVRTSVKLLKSFITMSGKAYDKKKAAALFGKMEKALDTIPKEDPYLSQLAQAMNSLADYDNGKDKTINIPAASLHGLGGIAIGGMNGLGVVPGSGEGAIIRLLRDEGVKNLSDATLKKAFRRTIVPGLCFEIAKSLMRRGELSMAVLNAPPAKKKSYWEGGVGLAGPGDNYEPSTYRGIDGIDILEIQLDRARKEGGMSGLGSVDVAHPPAARSSEHVHPPAPNSSASPNHTSDTVSARDLAKMTFKTIGYHGQYKDVIGDPATGFKMMVYGKPWQGKSSFVIELCKELATLGKGKVAYLCLEEGISQSMQKKVIDRGADKVDGLDFKPVMPGSFDGYSFVVIDSVSDRGMKRDRLRELFLHNPDTCFICIFHATKSGDARGGLDYSHDMDIIVRIEAHEPSVEKNRFL